MDNSHSPATENDSSISKVARIEIQVHEPSEKPTVRWVTKQNADGALRALGARLDSSKAKVIELMETVAGASRQISHHQGQAENFKKELDVLRATPKEDTGKIAELQEKIHNYKVQNRKMGEELEATKSHIQEQDAKIENLRLLERTSALNRDEFKEAYERGLKDLERLEKQVSKQPPELELGTQVGLQQLLHGRVGTFWSKYSGRTIAMLGALFIMFGVWWQQGFTPIMPVIVGVILVIAGALNGYDKESS